MRAQPTILCLILIDFVFDIVLDNILDVVLDVRRKVCFEMEEVVYIDKSSPLLRGLFRP